MPGHVNTADDSQRRSNAYANGPTNGMVKSNGYSKNKYYQSRNEKFNHLKSSINIDDPNDWPALGSETVNENGQTNGVKLTTRDGISSTDTNGTVFSKKKIVQTKNTSTSNGDIVETTVIEETETFSKLVISKEPSNKDSNNNRVINGTTVNDNESTTETISSSGANLDDSIDVSDEKENSKCDSTISDEIKKKKSSDQQSIDEQSSNAVTTSKSKKKSSKSKWKVLNIEQPSRPLMDKRKFERNHRDYREKDHRDSRVSGGNKRNKDFNNSNSKYGENNGGYYSRKYNSPSIQNQQPSQKDSQTVNTNGNNSKNNNEDEKSNNKQVAANSNITQSHTNQQYAQQQTKSSNQLNGHYYSNSYHRQKRLSAARVFRNNRSMSGYRQRNARMHYDSGNVTPLSDYDCTGPSNGYYLDQTSVPHQQIDGSSSSLSHQNGFVPAPAYFITTNIAYNPAAPVASISRTKWPYLDDSLRNQIEYYFSEENLQRDIFLRRKMDKDGYLPISLIASFHRVQALTLNPKHIIDSLRKSDKVELSEDFKKVRAKNEPSKWAILDPMYNLFEFGKANSNASSSCNSKDGSSTDSANDSRTSGVSLGSSGTTDLHPNVPDFIPGQPYGYLYDGANTTYGVLYNFPPASFNPHKNPIDNSYTINYQHLPYSNAYPLNSTCLTNNCLEEDSKTINNSDNINDEINPNEVNDDLKDASLPEDEQSINQDNNDQKDKLNNSNCELNKQSTNDQQVDTEISIDEINKNDSDKKSEVNEIKKEKTNLNKVELEQDNKENDSQILKSTNLEESNFNLKEMSSKSTTKDNSSKESLKENCPSKEINSSSPSSTNSLTSTSSLKNVDQPPQPTLPTKVLSYSDAIKLKQVNHNSNEQDKQIKKENDLPNKQLATEENQKENNIENQIKEHHKENRRDHKKLNEHKKSNKEFHGFRSAKSKNKSSVRK